MVKGKASRKARQGKARRKASPKSKFEAVWKSFTLCAVIYFYVIFYP